MSLEDFYAAQPPAPLGPDTLGLPPAPTPPQMPAAPQARKGRNPADLAALLTAAMLGPGAGTGVLQGIQQSKQRQREQDAWQQRQQQELWRQQEQVYRYQQQQYEQEAQRRQQTLQQNLDALRQIVPKVRSKEEYERQVDVFARGLQAQGLRVDANYLRGAVRYFAPTAKEKVAAAIKQWREVNPQNDELLKKNPTEAAKGKILVDTDDDGKPEDITIGEAMQFVGAAFVPDGKGGIAQANDMTAEVKANADTILRGKIAKAKAEGKRIDDVLVAELAEEAIHRAKLAGDLPNAPKEPRLVQVSRTDEETGEIVTELVPAVPGEVSRKPQTKKDPNQAQFTAGTYAGRMEQAEAQLGKLENTISGMNYGRFTVEGRLPAAAQSGAMQSYDQASRNFINAVLRRESGAVISPSEFAEARKQYLPQPGDTPDTIAQKRANRAYVIQQMKRAAGPAYEAPVAPPASGGGTSLTVGRFVVEQE